MTTAPYSSSDPTANYLRIHVAAQTPLPNTSPNSPPNTPTNLALLPAVPLPSSPSAPLPLSSKKEDSSTDEKKTDTDSKTQAAMKKLQDDGCQAKYRQAAWSRLVSIADEEALTQGNKLSIRDIHSDEFREMEFLRIDRANLTITLELTTGQTKADINLKKDEIVIIKYNYIEIDFTKSPEDQKKPGCCEKCTIL